jgi:1-acyl-sn-glycerol-3-phosphate acyltransferase
MNFYKFAVSIVGFFLRCYYKIEVIGAENIPQKDGFILCANHSSNLDPFVIGISTKREIRYMAKAEIFKIPVFRTMLKWVGTFPVERGSGDSSIIEYSAELIKKGEVLGLFPEGTRSKNRKLLRPKSGAAIIASMSKGDILPVGVSYTNKSKFRSKIYIGFGELLKNEDFCFTEQTTSEIRKVGTLIMEKISEQFVEANQYD